MKLKMKTNCIVIISGCVKLVIFCYVGCYFITEM